MANSPNVEEHYPEIGDNKKGRSEAVVEMFDVERVKLPQRTDLNLKEIQTFAMLKTVMQMLDPDEKRLGPEIYMDNIMEMKISLNRKGRTELKDIAQVQAEEKELADAFKG